jgi:platelet-activating factor acetylhydrolase IB subunit alpha
MIAYFSANSLPSTAAALRTELNIGEDVFDTATSEKYETLLVKKWTNVMRLQKKASYSTACLFSCRPLTGNAIGYGP